MTDMDFIQAILDLKEKRRAVILAHNYQLPEIQDIADFTGDSLGLSLKASQTQAEVIVFCGVYFMAETAKILSPRKTVLIPDPEAGCPMAEMITVEQLKKMKQRHPRARTLCYVNTSAEIKAECDVCCTSANAVEILKTRFTVDEEVIFVPDKYLASYAAAQTGRSVIPWSGYCPSHARILPEDITHRKEEHPQAKVIAHPECNGAVLAFADEVLSTSGMLKYARTTGAREIIVATETGLLYPLQKENPDKVFYAATSLAYCQNMKQVTLEKLHHALENITHEVRLPDETIQKAQKSLKAMVDCRSRTDGIWV